MKRSIFLGITTALTLVVLLAGFAYAATGWDSHPGSGPAATSQAASGSGQPTRSGTGRGSYDHDAVHQRTATRDNDCPGWTNDHPNAGRQGPRASGSTPTTSARPASQPRHDPGDHHGDPAGHDGCGQ
jgi:hypothetical protein